MREAVAIPHVPVLLPEVLRFLDVKKDEIIVDGTFGAGGYSRAILEHADCRVFGIDRDPEVMAVAKKLEEEAELFSSSCLRGEVRREENDGLADGGAAVFPHPSPPPQAGEGAKRFTFLQGTFGDMQALLAAHGVTQVDGIVLDIGVSSMQLDRAERGFSFQADGPLDMRMSKSGMSAAELINTTEEKALADILFIYGEEKASRRIARAIAQARAAKPIETTKELADLVAATIGRKEKKDPATRTFQALRIYVNDELRELERALQAAELLLKPGGRLVVVVFHSLEDRIVKQFLKERTGKMGSGSRHMPDLPDAPRPSFTALTSKAIIANDDEIRLNPRARSAKLRACLRTQAPCFPRSPGRR